MSQIRAEESAKNGDFSDLQSSQKCDDIVLLPNGDLELKLAVRESLVGPITELAADEKMIVTEWFQAQLDMYLSHSFVSRRVAYAKSFPGGRILAMLLVST